VKPCAGTTKKFSMTNNEEVEVSNDFLIDSKTGEQII